MTASATASDWAGIEAPALVADVALEGVYVGATNGPEVIDPDLPVDFGAPDWNATSVSRPPHYGAMTPAARAAFLVWHRTSRRATQAPTLWALLHLYGLERRILVDGDVDPRLRQEVRELGEVYGADADVARIAETLGGGMTRPTNAPPLIDQPAPVALQVELGRRALSSTAIDADWALAWAWYHPDISRREAARRVPDEFARLWRYRFTERRPDGLIATPRRRRLSLEYLPANPSLPTPLELTVADASDVLSTPGPTRLFAELGDQVESELAPYVRWATSHPDEVGGVQGAAVLPSPLLAGSTEEAAAQPLVDHIEVALGGARAAIADTAPLLALWLEATDRTEPERRDAVAIAQILDRFGLGIEPDVRFGGRPISRRSPAVVFRHLDAPVTSPSEAYAAGLVALELCAAVASADGTIDEDEQALLVEQVQRIEGLTETERIRLDAHRLLVTTSEVHLDDVASRVVGLAEDQRRGIGSYLLNVARVDGVVSDDERRTIRAVYGLLGLDPDEVDESLGLASTPLIGPPDLHDDGSGELFALQPAIVEDQRSDALFVVAPAAPEQADASTRTAPTSPSLPESAEDESDRLVALDEGRLRATQHSNNAVQDLLDAIFADEDDDDHVPSPAPSEASVDVLAMLDSTHSALLHELAHSQRLTRPELERTAARHGVLPDGALDVINEAALDLTDEPVIEVHDDESVTVDSAIYEEMRA